MGDRPFHQREQNIAYREYEQFLQKHNRRVDQRMEPQKQRYKMDSRISRTH